MINTVAAASALSNDQINALTGAELVTVHNLLTEGAEVKRFATRSDGVKRVTKLVAAARAAMPPVKLSAPVAAANIAKLNGHTSPTLIANSAVPSAVSGKGSVKKPSISNCVLELCRAGADNAAILAALIKEFPHLKNTSTAKAFPAWYRRYHTQAGRL